MRPDKARSGEAQLHDMVWAICVAAATHTWYATEWCRQSEWRLVIGQQDRWKWGTIDLLLSNMASTACCAVSRLRRPRTDDERGSMTANIEPGSTRERHMIRTSGPELRAPFIWVEPGHTAEQAGIGARGCYPIKCSDGGHCMGGGLQCSELKQMLGVVASH